jgi:hypothetical protein
MGNSTVRFIRERGNRIAVRISNPNPNTLFSSLDVLATKHASKYGTGKFTNIYYYGMHNVGINKGAKEYDAMFGFRRRRR